MRSLFMGAKRKDSSTPELATMDRRALVEAILSIECDFPIDLTEEYLQGLTLEKLRHVYVALCNHVKKPGPPSRS